MIAQCGAKPAPMAGNPSHFSQSSRSSDGERGRGSGQISPAMAARQLPSPAQHAADLVSRAPPTSVVPASRPWRPVPRCRGAFRWWLPAQTLAATATCKARRPADARPHQCRRGGCIFPLVIPKDDDIPTMACTHGGGRADPEGRRHKNNANLGNWTFRLSSMKLLLPHRQTSNFRYLLP
ncbi:uncharacterized protein [Triticum aestivum]|uniref:uncharacterized protein isoform X2 n=1 Tax=Triticum aestivum TaxID=4565 RepID=UPI00098A286F|nr:uncharacterized protein LOC109775279 isoform X2 [Aegilops tauschii subsp. strangulata]XP_044419443.1 uncharacterized protein LOC123144388 isoform X2 [Triticum aestivum]